MSKHKSLVGIKLFRISEEYINGLRKSYPNANEAFKYLPKYTVNNHNKLIESEYYLQFVGFSPVVDGTSYLMCDIYSIDSVFKTELDNSSIDSIFENENMSEILSVFTPHIPENIIDYINCNTNYIVVEIEWITSNYPDFDCDVNYKITGYLDDNLNFKSY